MSNEEVLLEWESFPLIENPRKTKFLLIILLVIFVSLWLLTVVWWEMPLFYVLGVLFIMLDLLPYFIPTRYKFYEEKIVIYYLWVKVERKYSDFRTFYSDEKGVMLGTFVRPRWLDRFRGQSIRYSKSQQEKEELLVLVERKVGNRR